jgi:hypothetical protein
VLLRREQDVQDTPAGVLHGLWSRIVLDAVVEFKSVARDFRRGELGQQLAYSGLYYWQEAERLGHRDHLLMVLLVAGLTPALEQELAALELVEKEDQEGYHQYAGGTFPLLVIETDRVAEAERDDLLGFLGRGTLNSDEAQRWLVNRMEGLDMGKLKKMDEYEDFETKLFKLMRMFGDRFLASLPPEQRLAALSPEQRLADLSPEQRLADLSPEQRLAGLNQEQKVELRRLLDEQN